MARLGKLTDFEQAAVILGAVTGVAVGEATVRRQTYAVGQAAVAVEAAERARLEREAPAPPPGAARQQLSLDATKVPLVGGAWTDVKVAVFGELVAGRDADGQPTVEATNLSYVARWEPADAFARTLLGEAHRRGLETAAVVASPNDGADWIQRTLDFIAPRAVRILDEPHAAEHLGTLGGLGFGEGTAEAVAWVDTQRARLKREAPAGVLAELTRLAAAGPCPGASGQDGLSAAAVLAREVAYFHKRADQVRYAAFRAAELPIGSGIVESGHKVLVTPRCKGAGQHWHPDHLSPLLELRTLEANGRWEATWPRIWAERQRARHTARRAATARRQAARRAARAAPQPPPVTAVVPPPPPPTPAGPTALDGARAAAGTLPRRPPANHRWRRPFFPSAKRTRSWVDPKN